MTGVGRSLRFAALLMAIVALAAGVWGLREWRAHVVLTSSMAPTIPAGSLALVASTDPTAVQPGDVLAFRDPGDPDGALIAHRVTVVLRSGAAVGFATRGDANERSDSWLVKPDDVEGTVQGHVPRLGALLSALRGSTGVIVAAALALTAALLSDSRSIARWLRSARSTPRDELHERLRALATDMPSPWRSL